MDNHSTYISRSESINTQCVCQHELAYRAWPILLITVCEECSLHLFVIAEWIIFFNRSQNIRWTDLFLDVECPPVSCM